MKQELRKYIKHGDVYRLSGPYNKVARQQIMRVMTGVKLPIARCGVTAIRAGLFEVSGVTGSCLAVKERNFTTWLNS